MRTNPFVLAALVVVAAFVSVEVAPAAERVACARMTALGGARPCVACGATVSALKVVVRVLVRRAQS